MSGRRAANVAIVAVLVTVLLGNLRADVAGRRLHAVGLQQSWDVYAPDPARFDVELTALLTFADGSERTWRPPRATAWAAARTHRWLLAAHRLATDAYAGRWDGLAWWIATHTSDALGRRPVRVVLRRRWSPLPVPGHHPAARRWFEAELFVLDRP